MPIHTLIIESDADYALIQELADREGESVSTVVVKAVEEMLEREQPAARSNDLAQRLIEIGKRTAPLWNDRTPHGDLLYDESGLPR